jgi:hypothetical protein
MFDIEQPQYDLKPFGLEEWFIVGADDPGLILSSIFSDRWPNKLGFDTKYTRRNTACSNGDYLGMKTDGSHRPLPV